MSPQNPFVYDSAKPATDVTKLSEETGVDKSPIINLMAGLEVASASSNLKGCTTMEATGCSFTLPGETPFCIYVTVGFYESQMGIDTFLEVIERLPVFHVSA